MSDRGGPITPEDGIAPDWRDRRIAELEGQLREAQATIAALRAQIVQLQQRIAELERAGKRQATPFARDKHKTDPRKPGRKAGQGLFSYRTKPTPDEVSEIKEARLDCCPECGDAVTDIKEHEQFVIDLPEIEPKVTRYVSQSGYCSRCGRRVRSRHPEQISTAAGAASVMIGPRAKALAADLKHRLGVSDRRGRRGALDPGQCLGDLSSTGDLGDGFLGQGAASCGRGDTVLGLCASARQFMNPYAWLSTA